MGKTRASDEQLIERIAALVERGNFPEVAAVAEGVPQSTWYDWMKRAAEGRQPWAAVSERIARAEARAEVMMVGEVIDPTPDGDGKSDGVRTRAKQWLLERTRRERYGERIEVRVMEKATEDLLERLRQRADPSTFAEVVGILLGEGGGEVPDDDG